MMEGEGATFNQAYRGIFRKKLGEYALNAILASEKCTSVRRKVR
jgi:hypothetical protein